MDDPLFMNYETDSKEYILKYFNLLSDLIRKKTDLNSPYIQGTFPLGVKDFLDNKRLNLEERTPENTLLEMSEYFSGTARWHHPYIMNNIKTPVNLPALAVAFNAMLIDPNLAGDTNCGQIAYTELEVVKYISTLIGWDCNESGGYFTFGGTSTLLNAVKVGINEALRTACTDGIKNNDLFIVSSQQGHSAHADVCNWLGLGKKNCVRIPTDSEYQIDIVKAEEQICERIDAGGKLVAIIACGGTTIQTIVDPIYQLYQLRDKIVKKYALNYKPHIHVDSVVGWPWLFYKGYPYDTNPQNVPIETLLKIKIMEQMVSECKYADSIGIDFHKTGFCPYSSSLFIVQQRDRLFKLNDKPLQLIDQIEYGDYSPSTYTLELSRSSVGPLTALTTLKLLGIQGFRRLLGQILDGSNKLSAALDQLNGFEVINKHTNGTCILYVIKPSFLSSVPYSEFYTLELNELKKWRCTTTTSTAMFSKNLVKTQ